MTRVAGLVAALALVTACGSDGSGSSRTVEVKALDTLRFDPATIAAKAGEKVTFRVTNTGAQKHEFVIGDKAFHDVHEAAANAGGSHGDHAEGGGSAVEVGPGETKTVDYTMPSQPPTFACHIAAHDDAGMTGTVTY